MLKLLSVRCLEMGRLVIPWISAPCGSQDAARLLRGQVHAQIHDHE